MKQKKEIKDQFEGKPIKEIENLIRGDLKKSREAEGEAMAALRYLEKTGRFKENPQYKKATFETYVSNEHGLSYPRYVALAKAYVYWPEEAVKYGGNVLAKASRKAGVTRMPSVLKDLEKASEKRKTPLPIQKIESTIQAHTPKKPATKKPSEVNWKREAERWRRDCLSAQVEVRSLTMLTHEQAEQIRKLKRYIAKLERRGMGYPVNPPHPEIEARV